MRAALHQKYLMSKITANVRTKRSQRAVRHHTRRGGAKEAITNSPSSGQTKKPKTEVEIVFPQRSIGWALILNWERLKNSTLAWVRAARANQSSSRRPRSVVQAKKLRQAIESRIVPKTRPSDRSAYRCRNCTGPGSTGSCP